MPHLVVFFALLLARVGAFVAVLPIFGGQALPRLVRVGLTMALTVMWAGSLAGDPGTAEWLAQPLETSWLGFGIALGREAVLGLLLGFAFGLFLVPARVAGEYLSQELGLSFGNMINPTGETATGSLTPLFDLLSTLVFLTLDVHHLFLVIFHALLTSHPLGAALPNVSVERLAAGATAVEEWGLLLVAPAAVCLFVTSVVLALMARAAPQMNVYSVGFPLRLLIGFLVALVLFPNFLAALVTIFGRCGELVLGLV
jgi:flagellar biosynthetic protein FliR